MTEPHRPHKLPPAPYLMQRQFDHHDLTWLDLLHPREEQIGYLRQRYAFHELHLADVISAQQRPKIDGAPVAEFSSASGGATLSLGAYDLRFEATGRVPVLYRAFAPLAGKVVLRLYYGGRS